eukprot:SAG11_NODE_6813_length_1242_cov_2.296588_2_plen_74_part_01
MAFLEGESRGWSGSAARLAAPGGLCEQLEVRLTDVLITLREADDPRAPADAAAQLLRFQVPPPPPLLLQYALAP